jgi:hypothetical protein
MTHTSALCPSCDLPMLTADGCTAVIHINAERWGHESHFASGEMIPLDRCPDCGATVGHHHHANCLQARCMICDDQAVMCDHSGENGYVIE